MESVGIYEAKAKLSELVERAAQGEEVAITRHGKTVARLVPARAGSSPDRGAVVAEMLRDPIKIRRRVSPRELRKLASEGRG